MKEWEREPIQYENLEDAIFSKEPDKINGKSRCLFEKAENYKAAISKLEILKEKGLLDFEFESPSEKLSLHAININWNFPEREPYLTIAADDRELITEILNLVDNLTLDEDSPNWMLSSVLYKMAD